MNQLLFKIVKTCALMVWPVALVNAAAAQQNGGYGQYFQANAPKGVTVGAPSTTRYMYDKYFYHRPTVSPYLNLDRPDTDYGTSYQAFVRPEAQRREASTAATRAYVQQRKLDGRVGATNYGNAQARLGGSTNAYLKPTARSAPSTAGYYNHWYGGWNKR